MGYSIFFDAWSPYPSVEADLDQKEERKGWRLVLFFGTPILLASMALRIPSLSFYPLQDEVALEIMGLAMAEQGSVHPLSGNWPPLLYFIHIGCAKALSSLGMLYPLENILPSLVENGFSGENPYLWMGRLLSGLFGTLTVFLIILTGRRIYGWKEGIWAGIFLASAPLAVFVSCRCTNDSLCALLVVLSVFLSVEGLEREKMPLLVLAAFVSGLATGAKYTGGISFVSPFTASLFLAGKDGSFLKRVKSCAFLMIVLVVGIIVSIPGLLTDPGHYAGWIFGRHASDAARGWVFFKGAPRGWWFHPFVTFKWGLGGYPVLLPAAVSMVYMFVTNRTARIVILPFLAAWFLLVGYSKVLYARYWAPFIPFLCLSMGCGLSAFRGRRLTAGHLLLAVIAAFPFYRSLGHAIALRREDTREEAKEWIRKNIPLKAKMASLYPVWSSPGNTARLMREVQGRDELKDKAVFVEELVNHFPMGLEALLWDTAYPDIDPRLYGLVFVSRVGKEEPAIGVEELQRMGVKYYIWSSFREGLCLYREDVRARRSGVLKRMEKICGKPIIVFSPGPVEGGIPIAELETWGMHSFWPKRPGPEIRIYLVPGPR